jgi:hypothetical protein
MWHIWGGENAYRVLVEKCNGKKPLDDPWDGNIKT